MAEKVTVPSSQVVQSIEEIAAQRLSALKAQIPVGGRKKAGGVTFARTQEEVKQEGARIFGADLKGCAAKRIFKKNIFWQLHTIQQPRRLFSFLALRSGVVQDSTRENRIRTVQSEKRLFRV